MQSAKLTLYSVKLSRKRSLSIAICHSTYQPTKGIKPFISQKVLMVLQKKSLLKLLTPRVILKMKSYLCAVFLKISAYAMTSIFLFLYFNNNFLNLTSEFIRPTIISDRCSFVHANISQVIYRENTRLGPL